MDYGAELLKPLLHIGNDPLGHSHSMVPGGLEVMS